MVGSEDKRDIQERLYAHHAEMCKVFSHPKRLEVINALRERELSVTELSQRIGVAMANLSQHLAMMRERGILNARKEGNTVYYSIANPKLLQAFDILREILLEQVERDAHLIEGLRR